MEDEMDQENSVLEISGKGITIDAEGECSYLNAIVTSNLKVTLNGVDVTDVVEILRTIRQ